MMVGLIRRSFTYMDEDMFRTLYSTMVRPILEYAQVIWSPWLKKHINTLEAVQRRATKLVPHIRDKTYEDRLRHLDLYSLSYRRRRGDLIQLYRLVNRKDNIDIDELVTFDEGSRTRGHALKLKKLNGTKNCRKFHFSRRVFNDWNRLSADVVNSTSLDVFKASIDKILDTHWCLT